MPVQADFVPLDTAKTWAKRLMRTSKTLTPTTPLKLSQCQLAVAQMLGYEHWHAMQKSLLAPLPRIVDTPPEHLKLRQATSEDFAGSYWFTHLGGMGSGTPQGSQGNEVFLEKRRNIVRLRHRIHGRLLDFGEYSIGDALVLVKSLFAGDLDSPHLAAIEDMLLERTNTQQTYLSGRLTLPNAPDLQVRYQTLPVYPNGFDMSVRGLSTKKRWNLTDCHLLPSAQDALLQAANVPDGVFVINGSTGTGKTALTMAVLNELSSGKNLKQGERRKRVVSVEDPPEYAHDGVMMAVERHNQATSGEAYLKGIHAAMRSDPDYLMVGEMRDKQTAQGVFQAARSGVTVFTSFNCTAGGVLERLPDFGVEDEKLKLVRGWASPRLLPVLCQECCVGDWDRGGMKQGPGCHFCKHMGIIGRQMVLDVWECKPHDIAPTPKQTASQLEQARQLVKEGAVSWEDAQDALGPLDR